MQTLEQLKAEQLELEQKLAQNKQKQFAIFDAEFCEKNGFCVGDIVFFKGTEGRIIGFSRDGVGRPLWYKISLFRKDRSLGSAERIVYDIDSLSRQQKTTLNP